MAMIDWFWEKEILSERCNTSFLTLIPKIPNPIGLNDYRPSSLIRIAYKIISKVMADRMKSVMGKLICMEQSTWSVSGKRDD